MSNAALAVEKRRSGNCNFQLDMNFLLRKLVCTSSVPRERLSSTIPAYSSYSCSFRKDNVSSNTLAIAAGRSLILTNSTASAHGKKWSAHAENICDISWLPDEPKIVSTSSDRTTVLWDAETQEKINAFPSFNTSHQCIDVCPGQSNMLAVISGYGIVFMWDMRLPAYKKPLDILDPLLSIIPDYYGILNCSKQNPVFQTTPCVAFQDSSYLVTANDHKPIVKIWDVRCIRKPITYKAQEPIRSVTYTDPTNISHGTIGMAFNSARNTLYVCCENNNIYALNGASYCTDILPFTGFVAGKSSKKISLSYDDQYLLCGSMDKSVYVWHTKQLGEPVIQLSGHSGDVTSADWHPHTITKLASCSNNGEVFIWETAREKYIKNNAIGHAEPYLQTPYVINSCDEHCFCENCSM